MAFHYRVSLQIRHPSADPSDIIQGLGRKPSRHWAAGDARKTPTGTALSGTYPETYCAFPLGGGEDGELALCLSEAVAELTEATAFFHDLRETGGSITFYVTWGAGDRGEVFGVDLLSRIANLGVDLGIEPLSAE